jgi:hypothetical protein
VDTQNILGSEVLDIGIGLSLLFLFVSLICAAVREGLEGWRKTRALQLHKVLREILDDRTKTGSGLVRQLYNHPSVYALYSGEYPAALRRRWWKRLPSYIPAPNFSGALLDIVVHGDPSKGAVNPQSAIAPDTIRLNVGTLTSTKVQRAVLVAFDFATDLQSGRKNLEDWYNSAMDRVSGWYKRQTQLILFALGLAAAILLNLDAITIAQRLGQAKDLRSAIVRDATYARRLTPRPATPPAGAPPTSAPTSQAGAAEARAPQADSSPIDDVALRGQLESLGLLVGWEEWVPPSGAKAETASGARPSRLPPIPRFFPKPQSRLISCRDAAAYGAASSCGASTYFEHVGYKEWAQMGLGWLVTAFAITLGAPFWFDVLNKFMVVRSTVKPNEKSGDEASKDSTGRRPEGPHGPEPDGPARTDEHPA